MCAGLPCRSQQPSRTVATIICTCSLCSSLAVSAVPLSHGKTDLSAWAPTSFNNLGQLPNGTETIGHTVFVEGSNDLLSLNTEGASAHQKSFEEDYSAKPVDTMVPLKVLAMFVVVLSTLGGVLPPIIGWGSGIEEGNEPPQFFWMRSFSAGIMVALALVHIIAEAFELMDGLCGDYPIAAIFVFLGVFVMLLIERISMDLIAAKIPSADISDSVVRCGAQRMQLFHAKNDTPHVDIPSLGADCSVTCQPPPTGQPLPAVQHGTHYKRFDDEQPSELPQIPTPSTTTGNANPDVQAQNPTLMLNMIEAGVVVHSVVIGLNLGVMCDNRTGLVGLIVALAFHQLFEGVGLGACVAAVRPHLTSQQVAIAMVAFVLTLPLGVVGGMLLLTRDGFDAKSTAQLWLRGSLDGISGGILLYIALVHFIAEDLSRHDLNRPENFWLRWQMFASILVGAGGMAVLGIWA